MNASLAALAGAARRRRERAEHAVRKALETAQAARTPITVTEIATAAGVSTDFIYRHQELRPQVEALRRARQSPARKDAPDLSDSTLVRRLTQQLTDVRREHREEVSELRRALEAAQGELLALRRQLQE
jgi:hypothetical protein